MTRTGLSPRPPRPSPPRSKSSMAYWCVNHLCVVSLVVSCRAACVSRVWCRVCLVHQLMTMRRQMGKNVLALRTLISLAHGMGGILGSAWPLVLQTLETLHSILHPTSAKSLLAPSGKASRTRRTHVAHVIHASPPRASRAAQLTLWWPCRCAQPHAGEEGIGHGAARYRRLGQRRPGRLLLWYHRASLAFQSADVVECATFFLFILFN